MVGKLEVISGPMFSGKSTELIRRTKRLEILGKSVLLINSIKDIRCGKDEVQTHDKVVCKGIKVENLSELPNDFDVYAVDEGQFFNGLYSDVLNLVKNGKIVIVAGLDGDFQRNEFGELLRLIPHCDEYMKLHALCKDCCDGTKAPFSKMIQTHTGRDSIDQTYVGAEDIYKAVCRYHYEN